jgi:hypothetical protein
VTWEIKVTIAVRMTLKRFRKEVVLPCIQNKWSEKSSKKMLKFLDDPRNMALASVENAAEADGGRQVML